MDYRFLGRSGLRVSAIGFGAMNFGSGADEQTAERMLLRALDAGVNLVDTADIYAAGASEEIVGRVLHRSGRRGEVVLATKCGLRSGPGPNDEGASRRHIIASCEDSLRRLGTDYIDLYQLHRPYFETAPEETLSAFEHLVSSGRVLQIGSSTHPAWYLMECLAVSDRYGWARYVSEQSPYNLLDRRLENERIPLALRHGVGIMPWSPLAGGILAGRYSSSTDIPAESRAARLPALARRVTEAALGVVADLRGLAADQGLSTGQLALLWVRDRPGVTSPIVGPRTFEQLEDCLAVAERPPLPDEVLARVDELVPPGTWVSDFHNSSGWTAWTTRPSGSSAR